MSSGNYAGQRRDKGELVRTFLWGALAVIIGFASLLSVKPDLIQRSSSFTLRSPIAQVLAMRGWIILALLATALVLAIVGMIRLAMLDRGRISIALALVMALAAGMHGVVMLSRGVSGMFDRSITDLTVPLLADSANGEPEGSITVLEFNTRGGDTTVGELLSLTLTNDVDVLVLSETSVLMGQELQAELANAGASYQEFDNGVSQYDNDYGSTVLLISSKLGTYTQGDITAEEAKVSAVRAVPVDGTGPQVIGVHPTSPTRALLGAWRQELLTSYKMCNTYPNAIVAGDFNSTADHENALHTDINCKDAGDQAGIGAVGTWPAEWSGFISSPIDRVLVNGPYKGDEGAIVRTGASDHRGILVHLTPTE